MYRKDWSPYIGEKLNFDQERDNVYDSCAVAVTKETFDRDNNRTNTQVVGHVPFELSRHIFYALQHGRRFTVKVTDVKVRRSPLTQGGLEITSEVCTDWGASNIVKNDVLKKFIRDNYDVEKSLNDDSDALLVEISRIINDGQDADDADNLMYDDDEQIMMEVSDSEAPEPREDNHSDIVD